MQTTSVKSEVTREGVQSETVFTIKATSKAFDILSSGLYSDKIQAIVRELSCNAYDAHVEAGKADVPIEINLPSIFNSTFYVKDYGIGLDHAGVTKLYTTYFESTKTESNDYIGALGLGSKSPFSYASTFLVESRFEGIKRVYTAFKNEQGMPSISLMGEEPTDEPNGLTVTLSVRRDDIDKFNNAARRALMYFNPKPVVIGRTDFAPYKLVHTVNGGSWKIRQAEYYAFMKGPYVVQGFVAYPIDASILSEHTLSEGAKALCTTDLDLYVNIGDVEVAASREALSYDNRTIVNLCNVLESTATDMRESFQREFDACTTRWEVAMLFDKLSNSPSREFKDLFLKMHRDSHFTWNGDMADSSVRLDMEAVRSTGFTRYQIPRGCKRATPSSKWLPPDVPQPDLIMDMPVHSNLHIIVDKLPKGGADAIRQFIASTPKILDRAAQVMLIRPAPKKTYDPDEIAKILEQLGNPTVTYLDTLPAAPKPRVASATSRSGPRRGGRYTNKALRLTFSGFSRHSSRGSIKRTFSRITWAAVDTDLSLGGYYVNIDRYSVLRPEGTIYYRIDEMLAVMKALKIIPADAVLHGFSDREFKDIEHNRMWVNLFDLATTTFNKFDNDPKCYSKMTYEKVLEHIPPNMDCYLVDEWEDLSHTVADGTFKQFMDDLWKLGQTVSPHDMDKVAELGRHIGKILSHTEILSAELIARWNVVRGTDYPLLHVTRWDYLPPKDVPLFVTAIIEYINLKSLSVAATAKMLDTKSTEPMELDI